MAVPEQAGAADPPSDRVSAAALLAHRNRLLASCPVAPRRLTPAEAARLPVHVERLGTAGPQVLVVHGGVQGRLGGGPATFSAQHALAALGWRLGLVERPGFGRSPSHGVDDMVADAPWIADLLDDGGSHVIGHSWGAAAALFATAQRPERVRSLTMVEPALHTLLAGDPAVAADPATLAASAESARWLMRAVSPADYARRFVESLGTSPAGAPPVGAAAAIADDDALAAELGCALLQARMASAPEIAAAAAAVAAAGVPVEVVTGGWSRPFDAVGAIVARLAGGRHTVIAAPHHFLQRVSAEAFNRAVDAFMREADAARGVRRDSVGG